MPPSRRRTRSGKSGAKAPQPDADAAAEITEITEIKQLLNLAEIDDSDRAQRLLETLRTNSESLDLSTLDDDLIRNILMKFNVDNTGQRPSLVRKLKLITDFSLPSFEGKTVKQLQSKQTVELVIYHLQVTGYLPVNKNNTKKEVLAKAIAEARKNIEDGKSYYKDLLCNEIMKKVKEKVGYRYPARQPVRSTLVKHLQDAEGHYEDKSDEWVRSEATTLIQLQVLWLLMNPNLDKVRSTMSKTELQDAIIELRNQGKQVPPSSAKSTLEEEEYGYDREKGRDPTPTKEEEAADSPLQTVNSGSSKGGGRDPPATTLHPSTSTFTTPKPKHNQGVNAKHSQRNEEKEVRGVVDDERDENTAGTPNATTASSLRGSIGSTDARAMNTQERTDSRVDDNSVVDSREGASMERNINLLTQFTIQCKTRIDQNEEGLGIEREKLELQKQEFKAHKQDYEVFKDGQRKCNEGQRKWNEGQEVFNENISDKVENLKEDTRKSARKVDKSARKVARAVHFLSKFHPGIQLSSPESVTSTDDLNDSVEENERNDNIGVALSAKESGEVLNPVNKSRGLFGSPASSVLGSSALVSGEQNNSNRGELVSNFDQNDASANAESGRSSLFESPKSSTSGGGLGLGTPQEVNSSRKSPVTSAAAAAASSLPNASLNNSNASETDELVKVVSNDAEDEGGAANNVDTDRSGSVEAGAKDEDGGGEEERTILQDALSASDEHVVELTWKDREEKSDERQGVSGGITKTIGETGINSVVSNTAAATATPTAAFGTDQGLDAAANADASSNLVKGSRELAEANKAISATEAKDDGGGEEERTILQDAPSASNEHVVNIANLLRHPNSTEDEQLAALDALQRVLRVGRNNNNNKYATYIYASEDLTGRLEQMQLEDCETIRKKIVEIFFEFVDGEEEEGTKVWKDGQEGWKYGLGTADGFELGKLFIEGQTLRFSHSNGEIIFTLLCGNVPYGEFDEGGKVVLKSCPWLKEGALYKLRVLNTTATI